MAETSTDKKKNDQKEKNTATLSKISNAIKGSEKLYVEGTDLLELLSHLEGELQARDVVIGALRSEQLKKVLYGCYAGQPRQNCPLSALQRDNFTSDASKVDDEIQFTSSTAESQIAALQNVIERQRVAAQKMADCLRESERRRSQLVLELDEEKNKHEHDTAQGDDITYELEKDRTRLKHELENEVLERQKLETTLKDNTVKMEEEKSKQKQIVLVLLSDRKKLHKLYLEEKKRSEDLAQMLEEEKTKMETMAVGLEEESKRSLAMEAELEKHMSQFGSERQQLRDKLVADERRYRDLEDALRKARSDTEHFKKQLAEAHRVAMSQASPPPPYPGNNLVTAQQQISVSPTPLSTVNRTAITQSYATYSNYSTYGQVGNVNSTPVNSMVGNMTGQGYQNLVGTVPRTVVPSTVSTSRATQGNPVVRSLSGNISNQTSMGAPTQPNQQSAKFHSTNYNNTSVSGGFGHASHPAMIAAGGTLSHLDQEIIPSDIYSQISKPTSGVTAKSSSAGAAVIPRKSASEMTGAAAAVSAAARKPGLGKGVPPPVPPNKPVVPVKKDIGKQRAAEKDSALSIETGKQSMVTGLQGLKFGISIGGGADSSKGMKPLSESVAGVPTKKFFNNIESKS